MNPLDSVGGHQSQLLVPRPVVSLLACIFHGIIWTELIADPIQRTVEVLTVWSSSKNDKQSI